MTANIKSREDLAKDYSEKWNKFRISLGESVFYKTELTNLALMEKLPYSNKVPGELIKEGYLIKAGERLCGNGLTVDTFKFKGDPIHYSLFKRIYEEGSRPPVIRPIQEDIEKEYKKAVDVFSKAVGGFSLGAERLRKNVMNVTGCKKAEADNFIKKSLTRGILIKGKSNLIKLSEIFEPNICDSTINKIIELNKENPNLGFSEITKAIKSKKTKAFEPQSALSKEASKNQDEILELDENSLSGVKPLSKMGVSLQKIGIEDKIIKEWNNAAAITGEDNAFLEYVMTKNPIEVFSNPTIIIEVDSEHERDCINENRKNIMDYIKIKIPNAFDTFKWRIRVNNGVHNSKDKELADELRKRGYEVSAKKMVEL